jgi:tripartite-type tricarboxylate transporter receptor subunit TctC
MKLLTFAASVAAAVLSFGLSVPAAAQSYPDRPLRIIVPTGAGGDIDAIARSFQREFEAMGLFPSVVVLNQPGGGGTIGTRALKDADPDGYTIGLWQAGVVTSRAMGIVEFDHTAFEILGGSGAASTGIGIKTDGKYADMPALIEGLRANPESVTFATNIGLPVHFIPMMFAEQAGIEFRFAQIGGGADRLASILGGHTDVSMFSTSEFLRFADSGISPLMLFSAERDPKLPDVPTALELGIDFSTNDGRIWLAPAGVPEDRLAYLSDAIQQVLQDPEVRAGFEALGLSPEFRAPELVRGDLDKMLEAALPLVDKARQLAP